ncbi:MAG: hypothetical protein KF730_13335 [Sphingomonas sp.]|uniref:hypothetical protein n=1 Tax=Sphingomonas sp. TaxID=28214 RepID=UPI0025D6DE1A|nr:hypothetical protein [Sphingomonas sp.]MBX3565546.1 hypothetical protein [Sphingomonas sp.]
MLLLALFGLFALDNVLVPVFLGKVAVAAASAVIACGFLALSWRHERAAETRVAWRTLGICLAIACTLLLLGGEGRLFYANEDWQVRDAVLADMARNPWPFAYLTDRGEQVLRAPLGMYLLPALFGRAAEFALLACNTLVLGVMLSLASMLFRGARARRIALAVLLAFSGLDIVGTLLANASGIASFDHLERWAPPLQYSSVITLIFWVPQHAFAGWFCALLYLLHRRGLVSLGTLAASIPIAAIWSPLAVIGALPLAGWAGVGALRSRALRWSDIGVALAALAATLPALAYIASDAQKLPSGLQAVAPVSLILFLLLEVAPFVWIACRLRATGRFGVDSLILVAVTLALIPFFHIGEGGDFVMRASIAPLAVLAAIVAASLIDTDWRGNRRTAAVIVILLSLGAVTGVAEIARALRYAPAPSPDCTLPEVWTRQTGWVAHISTYLARSEAIPAFLHPQSPVVIVPRIDPICWSRPWKTTR